MTNKLDINIKNRYVLKGKVGLNPTITLDVRSSDIDVIRRKMIKAINRASALIAIDLPAALDEALRRGVWETPSGRADIVDTGELLESGSVTITNDSIKIAYDTPYSALVHYGGYIVPYGNSSRDKVYLPPRPWINAVLNGGGPVPKFDFNERYRRAIEEEFS